MDSLASRGTNKVYQSVASNKLPDENVYTGGGTQASFRLPQVPMWILVFSIVLFYMLGRQK